MIFKKAPDVRKRLKEILKKIEMSYVKFEQIAAIRSYGSKSRAIARIWAFPTIWQEALGIKPHYVIEVLSEKFDRQNPEQQTKTLIHELLHIPSTFSGALRPHRTGSFHLGRELEKVVRHIRKVENKKLKV